MKTHISSDPGLRLTPRGRRALLAIMLIGVLLLLALAATDSASAKTTAPSACKTLPQLTNSGATSGVQPVRLCKAWLKMCTHYSYPFGIRVCDGWYMYCMKHVRTDAPSKIAGLAMPVSGNKGGCGRGNMITLSCNVSDAGPGFVSGKCEYGHWFSRVSTARTFRVGQIVTARGCAGLNSELYAPIRISK